MKYFNARLSDGKSTVRVVSLNPTFHDTLQDYHHKSTPIALTDCLIKHVASQYQRNEDNKFEIVASDQSSVKDSPHIFNLPTSDVITTMDQLHTVKDNTYINVIVKVNTTTPTELITTKYGKTLKKKDCIVCDQTGSAKLVLWEDNSQW